MKYIYSNLSDMYTNLETSQWDTNRQQISHIKIIELIHSCIW
jgi:hypothetical protein